MVLGNTTLSVEKTSKQGGKIIMGDATEKDASKKSDSNPLTEILKCPTKVVLLRTGLVQERQMKTWKWKPRMSVKNMAKLENVAPDDETVGIFLEFERVESAIKAIVDLNGRYFSGPVVEACFHNLDKFRVLDLAERV
ncbi:hypothetical protein GH733_007251 [Mirounga leonina]|nr:hypothetical protein GH733_007251 [Mirounga leonina]